jgi:hypothetical protein
MTRFNAGMKDSKPRSNENWINWIKLLSLKPTRATNFTWRMPSYREIKHLDKTGQMTQQISLKMLVIRLTGGILCKYLLEHLNLGPLSIWKDKLATLLTKAVVILSSSTTWKTSSLMKTVSTRVAKITRAHTAVRIVIYLLLAWAWWAKTVNLNKG